MNSRAKKTGKGLMFQYDRAGKKFGRVSDRCFEYPAPGRAESFAMALKLASQPKLYGSAINRGGLSLDFPERCLPWALSLTVFNLTRRSILPGGLSLLES